MSSEPAGKNFAAPPAVMADAHARLDIARAAAGIGTWVLDVASASIEVDAGMAELYGLPPDMVMQQTVRDALIQSIHPDDRGTALQIFRDALASPTSKTVEEEFRVVSRDGIRDIFLRGQIERDSGGVAVRVLGVSIDITERKREQTALADTRRRLDAALVAGEIGTWVLDVINGIVYADANLGAIFGVEVPPDSETSGIPLQRFLSKIHPDDSKRVESEIAQSLAADSTFRSEYRIITGDRERHVVARGTIERDASGRPVRMPGVVLDITDRTRAENARRELDLKLTAQGRVLEAVFNSISDPAYIIDLEGRFRFANKPLLKLWNVTDLGPTGQSMEALQYPPDVIRQLTRDLNRVVETRQSVTGEVHYFSPSGYIGTFEHQFSPIFDAAGSVISVAGSSREVSERKRVERELRESQQRYSQAVEAAGLGTFYWTLPYTPETDYNWNATLRSFFYVPPDVRVTPHLRNKIVHPEDRDRVNEALNRAVEGEDVYDQEYRVVGPNGQIRWLHGYGQLTPGEQDGKPVVHFGGIVIDVTTQRIAADALRRSEAEFRQIADVMPQIVWAAQPDGTVNYYNRRWYEYTGMPLGTVGNRNAWPVNSDDAGINARWQDSVRTGKPYEEEFRLRRASDGTMRWHLGRALPLRDSAGNITRWLGTNTDIHDFKELQAERERLLSAEQAARADAELQSRMKDEFLATLSHELRTPLNAIVGWVQILRDAESHSEDMKEGLAVIDRNARSQTQIIEDILDMSRIISGKLRLDVQRVELDRLLRAAVESIQPAADAKGVRLHVLLDPNTGPSSGDPNRLQQVFWNLLSNAVKFTPRGGRVQVMLERINSHVEISVIDTGEGIDTAFLPFVFDRFRQADSTTTRRHGGLGLGLSIVKQMVEMHGGSVIVKSPGLGKGSTFTVILPLAVIHAGHADAPLLREHPKSPAMTEAHNAACGQLEGVSVMIVDDEADGRLVVKRLLEECGAIVRTAGSAAEAFAMYQKELPDVFVSDIGMPEEDGYSLIRRIRTLPENAGGRVPAVALTAYARASDRIKALEAGFQMHLAKPVEPAELIVTIAALAKSAN